MGYQIKGKLSNNDYYHFIRYHLKRNISYGIMQIIVFFSIAILVFTLDKLIVNPSTYLQTININLIIFVLLFCIYSYINPLFKSQSYYKSNKYLNEEQNIKISEDKIVLNTSKQNIIIEKEYLYKIGFDKKYIYLYTSNDSAVIIPFFYCKDINEFNEIKTIVYKYYNPYKKNTKDK